MDLTTIRKVMEYIDQHLDEQLTLDTLANRFHFSPHYFHRMFSAITGKTLAVYIRDRRLLYACLLLINSDSAIQCIGMDIGYDTAQSFSRTFRSVYGVSPRDYRKQGIIPDVISVEDLIIRFTNRLQGGMVLSPKIIKKSGLRIVGRQGDGSDTSLVWEQFMKMNAETPVLHKRSDNGYEVRIYDGNTCTVYVGYDVNGGEQPEGYSVCCLPASEYASFEVYVALGYDSENTAMEDWLASNDLGYKERLLEHCHYCVEFYDERFKGAEVGSIVEIWLPVYK